MVTRRRLIIVNCIIAVNVLIIAFIGIVWGAGSGQLGNYIIGWGYLKPYTMDSNILTGFAAALVVVYSIKNMGEDRKPFPRWLMGIYLMGTTCLVLTFLIAALFLAPMEAMSGRGYFVMFSGDMFFFHFINPILATISLIALLDGPGFTFADRFTGMIPTVVYSIVYFTMVMVLKWWDDFYNFTFGGKYYLIPFVIVVVYGLTYGVSYLLIKGNNMHNRTTAGQ